MDNCCDSKTTELINLRAQQKGVLIWVLIINLVMFLIEGGYGLLANSVALLADSLDMLGDAFIYGISLYALGRSARWNAGVSLLKGIVMVVFGVGVFFSAFQRFSSPVQPIAELMGIVGGMALVANLICAALLLRHRNSDINMRSTWLCSRNDVIANIGVLGAALGVALTGSKYPDLIIGILIASLVLKSGFQVTAESLRSIKI